MTNTKGSTALVTYKGKILIILRDDKPDILYPNLWSLPGGGIEEGETLEQNILRECKEEIGVSPAYLKYMGMSLSGSGRFSAELTDEEYERITLGDEGQKLGFYSLDEMENMELAPRLKQWLNEYRPMIEKILRSEYVKAEELGLIK